MLFHDGGIPGFSTLVALLPEDGVAATVLINADSKADVASTILQLVLKNAIGAESSISTFVIPNTC
jgi:hypothetical protein